MSRDRGKNKAKLIFEVQSGANWCKLCTIQFWENIWTEEAFEGSPRPALLTSYYLTQQDNYPLSTAHWKQDLRRSWPIEGLRLSLRAEVHLPEATYDEKFVVGVGTVPKHKYTVNVKVSLSH